MFAHRKLGYVVAGAIGLLLTQAGIADARKRPRKHERAKFIRNDTIRAGSTGVLRIGPGDSFKSSGELPAGTALKVVALKGRWAQVVAGKRRGWMLRRALSGYQPTLLGGAKTPDGSAKREWGGPHSSTSFDVQVASQTAVLRAEPVAGSASVGTPAHGTALRVISRSSDRRWIQVRTSDGALGWILSDLVQSTTMANVDGEAWRDGNPGGIKAEGWKRSSLPRLQLSTSVGIGYRSMSMDFSSLGSGALANTITDSQAMAAEGLIDAVWRTSGRRIFVGIDGRFRTSYAKPGIEVIRDDMSIGNVAFNTHESAGALRAGVMLGDVAIAARAGGRYDVFLTRSVDNVGLLPRESLSAAFTGVRLDWYRLAPEIVITVQAEMLVKGRHKQTAGLEDGAETKIRGGAGEVRARYQASDALDIFASFHYGWRRYDWTGQSARNPDVMESERRDDAQSLGLGLAHRF